MTSFLTRSGPDGDGAYVHTIIVTTDNDKHYKYVQEAARFCIDHMKPRTNADRIRSMTDEELAEFLAIQPNCLDCEFSHGWLCDPDRNDYSDTEKCVEGKKRWLKQPCKEDG